MYSFRVKDYYFKSPRIPVGRDVSFCLISDLHGVEHGEKNRDLLQALEERSPDVILIPGDMVIRKEPDTCRRALSVLKEMGKRTPVIYSPGNHETFMECSVKTRVEFQRYKENVKKAGIIYLENEEYTISLKDMKISFYGLELPGIFYRKPCSPGLKEKTLETYLGKGEKGNFRVLLAHNPKYMHTYFKWGADLTVSGHYHGGILRFSEHAGALSPQFHPFPGFCCGDFRRGFQGAVVSAGLGEHTLPLRIHNPRELLVIHFEGGSHGIRD